MFLVVRMYRWGELPGGGLCTGSGNGGLVIGFPYLSVGDVCGVCGVSSGFALVWVGVVETRTEIVVLDLRVPTVSFFDPSPPSSPLFDRYSQKHHKQQYKMSSRATSPK